MSKCPNCQTDLTPETLQKAFTELLSRTRKEEEVIIFTRDLWDEFNKFLRDNKGIRFYLE